MNRTPEQWKKVDPDAVVRCSSGRARDVITMMQHDIARLVLLVRELVEADPDYPIADSGETALDFWRHEARKALGIPRPEEASSVRLPARSRR